MPARPGDAAEVRPDLPVTPMLDVSFQLLAFFVLTFRPTPAETQFTVHAPKEGSAAPVVPFVPDEDTPATLVVTVEAGPGGTIGPMTIREETGPPAEALGASLEGLSVALRARRAALGTRPARVALEVADGVRHETVVRLIDVGTAAGFADVAADPADYRRR